MTRKSGGLDSKSPRTHSISPADVVRARDSLSMHPPWRYIWHVSGKAGWIIDIFFFPACPCRRCALISWDRAEGGIQEVITQNSVSTFGESCLSRSPHTQIANEWIVELKRPQTVCLTCWSKHITITKWWCFLSLTHSEDNYKKPFVEETETQPALIPWLWFWIIQGHNEKMVTIHNIDGRRRGGVM